MKRALVTRNILDLLAEPVFHTERKTQLLFGEPVTVRETREGYALVEQPDGYSGWAVSAGVSEISEKDWSRLKRAFQLRVSAPVGAVTDKRGAPVKPYFLPYGSIVFPTEAGDNGAERIEIAAPDKIRRWVQRDDLTDVVDPAEETTADLQESIILSAVQFLGVPYLWGGRSPMGFDCSGLVQIIYGMHGINLPRDSAEQRLVGREVSRGQLAPGDLIYSPGHVVIYMEADRFIHASLGEGGVEINSYDPHDENYREDLDRDFAVARRVVGETLSD